MNGMKMKIKKLKVNHKALFGGNKRKLKKLLENGYYIVSENHQQTWFGQNTGTVEYVLAKRCEKQMDKDENFIDNVAF